MPRDGHRPPRHALAAVLAAFTALALGFNLAVPLGEAPDEPSHLQLVLFLRKHHRLPSLPPPGVADAPDLAAGPQAKHPPLHYLVGALLAAPFDVAGLGFVALPTFVHDLDRPAMPNRFAHRPDAGPLATPGDRAARAARLASLVGGWLLVVGTWRLARRLWPADAGAAATAAAVVAFTPGVAWLCGVFNNDATAAGTSAMALSAAAAVAAGGGDPPARRRRSAALGAWVGVALLAKLTTVFLVPTAALALALGARRAVPPPSDRRAPTRRFAADAAVAAASTAAVAGWWFAANAVRYGWRDPLGWQRWSARIPELERSVPLSSELGRYLTVQFESYWGRFGWMTIRLPDAVYVALAAAVAVAAVGWVALAAGAARRAGATGRGGPAVAADATTADAEARADRGGRDGIDGAVLAVVVAGAALAYASILRLGLRFDLVVAQGRYVYVAAAAVAVLLVAGWRAVVPRRGRRGAAVGGIGALLALCAYALVGVVAPAHRPPPADAAPVASPARGDGPAIDLEVDGRLAVTAVARRGDAKQGDVDGDGGQLRLAWRSLRPFYFEGIADGDGPVAALDQAVVTAVRGGRPAARLVATPLDGRFPAMAWPVGRSYIQTIDLPPVFAGAALQLSFVRSDDPAARLALTTASGAAATAGPDWVVLPRPDR